MDETWYEVIDAQGVRRVLIVIGGPVPEPGPGETVHAIEPFDVVVGADGKGVEVARAS